jgi:hypothetical protein
LRGEPQRLTIESQVRFLRPDPFMRRLRALLLTTPGFGILAAGCGPSLTTIHEGTLRFEHCYRIDLEPDAKAPQQQACWSRWLGQYTYGQSRDRIDYARRRLSALNETKGPGPELRLTGERRAEERQFYVVAPAPEDLHGPPPPVATALPATLGAGDATPMAGADNAKDPPASPCAKSCGSAWSSCEANCGAPIETAVTAPASGAGSSGQPSVSKAASGKAAGGKSGGGRGCDACASAYGRCMRGCFE